MAEFINIADETIKEKTEKTVKTSKPPPQRRSKPVFMPCPAKQSVIQALVNDREKQKVNVCSVDQEVKMGLKDTALTALSCTFPDKHRRGELKGKLEKSECVNKYIDSKISGTFLNVLNDHLKFGVVYAFNWIDVWSNSCNAPAQIPNANPNPPPKTSDNVNPF